MRTLIVLSVSASCLTTGWVQFCLLAVAAALLAIALSSCEYAQHQPVKAGYAVVFLLVILSAVVPRALGW